MIVQRGQPYLAIDEMPNVPNSEQCKTHKMFYQYLNFPAHIHTDASFQKPTTG